MYSYAAEKPFVFTDEGQKQFLSIRDRVKELINKAGCCTMEKAMAGECGSSWQHMACVDRLVELGEIKEVPNTRSMMGQHRIFFAADLR